MINNKCHHLLINKGNLLKNKHTSLNQFLLKKKEKYIRIKNTIMKNYIKKEFYLIMLMINIFITHSTFSNNNDKFSMLEKSDSTTNIENNNELIESEHPGDKVKNSSEFMIEFKDKLINVGNLGVNSPTLTDNLILRRNNEGFEIVGNLVLAQQMQITIYTNDGFIVKSTRIYGFVGYNEYNFRILNKGNYIVKITGDSFSEIFRYKL